MKLKFDFEFAKDSLRFYRAEDIPKIAVENIPNFVSDVRFKSDLAGIITFNLSEDKGELFDSI